MRVGASDVSGLPCGRPCPTPTTPADRPAQLVTIGLVRRDHVREPLDAAPGSQPGARG
jgi:hypothetical protein